MIKSYIHPLDPIMKMVGNGMSVPTITRVIEAVMKATKGIDETKCVNESLGDQPPNAGGVAAEAGVRVKMTDAELLALQFRTCCWS